MHPAAKLADIADAMIFEPLLYIQTASRPAFKIDRFHVEFYLFSSLKYPSKFFLHYILHFYRNFEFLIQLTSQLNVI